jgi:hypothetical protein
VLAEVGCAVVHADQQIATVDAVLTPEVASKLVQLLEAKPKRETYETRALTSLKETHATQPASPLEAMPEKPVRGKGKKKGAAHG